MPGRSLAPLLIPGSASSIIASMSSEAQAMRTLEDIQETLQVGLGAGLVVQGWCLGGWDLCRASFDSRAIPGHQRQVHPQRSRGWRAQVLDSILQALNVTIDCSFAGTV